MSQDQDFKDKILLAIHADVADVRGSVAVIQSDLKEHMRRTAVLETKVASHEKYLYMFHGAAALVAVLWAVVKYVF